ncbi:similar to Saccharomyces cerevisiae YER158C Protein of unknown function, has similarity to Afr1p [Maudiozyma saulgeensis]|uniref:Uncharacterized protein n=1 Tax=Maudiozyma saulgeensis TaxID=1789683 RepID=A0A1X7R665_9SACH|nr:similar to Saccharomyces cerevisiae YER158C Protein of unknown function, has similarity to Afr1p [Kazachstania saulgeensis]
MQTYNSPYANRSLSSLKQNHIARSNSTSDLFDLTADMKHKNIHSTKKKSNNQVYHMESITMNNNKNIDNDFYITNNHATKKKLTPYQVQRQKMQKSFMFPNGENFTPKRSKHYKNCRNNFTKNENVSTTSINSAPTINFQRSNSLATSSNRTQMIMKHKKLSTWSLNIQDKTINNGMPDIMEVKAQSPVTSKKSSDSDNSMKDDSQSNNTLPTTDSDIEILQENIIKPIVLSEKNMSSPSVDLTNNVSLSLTNKDSNEASPPKVTDKVETKIRKSSKRHEISSSESLTAANNIEMPKKKRSSSGLKLSTFFRRIFGGNSSLNESHKKRKLNKPNENVVSSKLEKNEAEKEKPMQLVEDITLSLDLENEIDNNLMDTDLIFDSILLKMNNGKTTTLNAKPKKIENFTPIVSQKEIPSVDNSCQDPNFVDHNLINDFAKLGNFINLSISDDINQPPPRSSKRPTLDSKRTASEFYNSQQNIIRRLQNEFGIVLMDETPSKETSSSGKRTILKIPSHVNNKGTNKKSVQFTDKVYLTNTYSLTEYERKDRGFKRRMTLLMQGDRTFFDSVKKELNYYKSHEMAVHQDMKQYTQFFD